MGLPLLRPDRLRERYEADQASADWQWQSSSLGSGSQRIQEDWQTRVTSDDRYCNKLDTLSIGTFRNWQNV